MTIASHIAVGLIVGKITDNYPLALAVSLLLDLDHVLVYFRNGVFKNFKKFWTTVTNEEDPYGNQRNVLHSIFTWGALSLLTFLFLPKFALTFTLAYLGHLLLDLLDSSDYQPFYPIKWNVKGPIKYFSYAELLFCIAMIILYFFI